MSLMDPPSSAAAWQRPAPERTGWQKRYAKYLAITDTVVIAAVILGTQLLWIGTQKSVSGLYVLDYSAVSLILIVAWLIVLSVYDTRSPRVIGYDSGEYRAIASGALRLFGVVAIVSYLAQAEVSRGYILISFPLGVLTLMVSRWLWRRWLRAQRARGEMISRVLLIGRTASNLRILEELARHPEAGYQVVAACRVSSDDAGPLGPTKVPVVGTINDVPRALETTGADTVLVSSESGLSAASVRALSWQLEAGQQHLIMAPNLTDIGGPRIHMRPVAGLPLMHVETPKYTGPQVIAKRAFDLISSSLLIVILSPLLLVIAIFVKASTPGHVLFGQERVGINGTHFQMLKFRSMITDADAQLNSLLEARGSSGSPLFKVKDDPRVTRVGRVLRKYSLDELPQLLNVFKGSMSLVGPRPQRDGEVALYDDAAHRRLIVKPGMSGLWQVSGRSKLTWEEAIRLDLYYVENWSLTGDFNILMRTFKAVFSPGETAH